MRRIVAKVEGRECFDLGFTRRVEGFEVVFL